LEGGREINDMRRWAFMMMIGLACLPLNLISAPAQDRIPDEPFRRWGRDPFILPEMKSSRNSIPTEDGLHLSAIIYRDGDGVAIINNRILREGDSVEGKRIEEILPDRVVLTDSTGRREIRVDQFKMDR